MVSRNEYCIYDININYSILVDAILRLEKSLVDLFDDEGISLAKSRWLIFGAQ